MYKKGLKYRIYHEQNKCPFGKCENCSCIWCGKALRSDRKNRDPFCSEHRNKGFPEEKDDPLVKKLDKKMAKKRKLHDKLCEVKANEQKEKLLKVTRRTCPKHTPSFNIETDFDLNLKKKERCPVCMNNSFKVVPNIYCYKEKTKLPEVVIWFNGVW